MSLESLNHTLQVTRNRWKEAKRKGDSELCLLYEKIGKAIKLRIVKLQGDPLDIVLEEAKNIFGG